MLKIHHICIQTTKYRDSINFYKEILGFNLIREDKNFNSREYNSWLELSGFYIEIQTPKKNESSSGEALEGIKHFCLYSDNFLDEYQMIISLGFDNFKRKNGSDIYEIEGNRLFKLISPEGTIIEIRDSIKP